MNHVTKTVVSHKFDDSIALSSPVRAMTRSERRKALNREKRMKAVRGTGICVLITAASLIGIRTFGIGLPSIEPGGTSSKDQSPLSSSLLPVAAVGSIGRQGLYLNPWSEAEVIAAAKTVYGESMITGSDKEMAAVMWCILNRVDSPIYPDSIMEVITAPRQFHGYHEDNPVDEHIESLVRDVLNRWQAEKQGANHVGRVLPAEYLFFWGDGWNNHFTTEYLSDEEWDWSLPNPYDT